MIGCCPGLNFWRAIKNQSQTPKKSIRSFPKLFISFCSGFIFLFLSQNMIRVLLIMEDANTCVVTVQEDTPPAAAMKDSNYTRTREIVWVSLVQA